MGAAAIAATTLTAGAAIPTPANPETAPTALTRSADVDLAALRDTLGLLGEFLSANLANLGIGDPAATPPNTEVGPGFNPMRRAPGAPDPADIPDLTFGLGQRISNGGQNIGAPVVNAVLETVNLSSLLESLGLGPESAINDFLGNAIMSVLAGIELDLPEPIQGVLAAAGLEDLAALVGLIGLNLLDPLNLGGDLEGLNIVTTGPLFTLLKFLGIDLGWTAAFPNEIADEVNGTVPLGISAVETLDELLELIPPRPIIPNSAIRASLIAARAALNAAGDINVGLRMPVVVGFGWGAFAAGAAYSQMVDDLANQPGTNVTVPVLLLLRNPGRANGGALARVYPLAALLGLSTVTPDTAVQTGGSNVIPVKVDATVEYDPISDVPAWPNPVSLANSVAALLPTYILRSLDADVIGDSIAEQVNIDPGTGAINVYVTLPAQSLPLLEPVRLPVDVANLVLGPTTGVRLNNPVATAVEPALKILVNLGYTDVDQNNGYQRTHDMADVLTPFGTIPQNVDWLKVPGDVVGALGDGVQQAFSDGLINRGSDSDDDEVVGLRTAGTNTELSSLRNAGGKLNTSLKELREQVRGKVSATAQDNKTASSLRKTPVKDAITKAGQDMKNAVDRVSSTVKERLTPKKKVDAGPAAD